MQRQRLTSSVALAALLLAAGASGGTAGVAHGIAGATIPNIQITHDRFAAHAEPSLAVDPRDPRTLLGAAMYIQGHHVVAGTFSSSDGGESWRDRGPLVMPPGTTYSGDVTAAFDAHGAGFVSSLVQTAHGDGVYVWRSDDLRRRFSRPIAVARLPFADHPGMAIESAPAGGGDLYLAWRTRGGLEFSRSVDGGHCFSRARVIVPGDQLYVPVVAAGPGGAVYVAYEVVGQDGAGRVALVASTDHGRHFGAPTVLGPMPDTLAPAPVVLPSGPSVAADPRGGAVYLAYVAYRAGTAQPAVLLARSGPGGRDWSVPAPIMAPTQAGAAVPFQPHVVVDAAGGVDISYLALAHGRVAVELARSMARGAGFAPPRAITNRPFNPALGVISAGKGQQGSYWWIGDYQGLATGGGLLYPCWSDTRSGHLETVVARVPLSAVGSSQ